MKKPKAVFLDRDGVINLALIKDGKPFPPASLEELKIATDALPALTKLKSLGYLLIGATNQPDVARGTTERSTVEAINAELMRQLPLDEILVCYHDDDDACHCRKPQPGLLLRAQGEYDIDFANSIMIGDRWKDIAAGQKVGCKTIFIDNKYEEKQPESSDATVTSLAEAASWIEKLST